MKIKKINAVCGLLLSLTLVLHLSTMTISMLTGWCSYSLCKIMARGTATFAIAHAALCIILFFFFHDGSDLRTCAKFNVRTVLQRICAILIIIFLHLHMEAFGFITSGERLSAGNKAFIIITEIIFFGSVLSHAAVSFSRSLISLGLIRSAKAEKATDSAAYIICCILFLAAASGVFLYVTGWIGFEV